MGTERMSKRQIFAVLAAASIHSLSHGQTFYPYFAPGGDIACTGACTNQTVAKTNGVTFATSATTDTTNAGNISSGLLATSRLGSCVINAQTGTTYQFVLSDANNCVTMNNASAQTVTLPANATVAFPVGTRLANVRVIQ